MKNMNIVATPATLKNGEQFEVHFVHFKDFSAGEIQSEWFEAFTGDFGIDTFDAENDEYEGTHQEVVGKIILTNSGFSIEGNMNISASAEVIMVSLDSETFLVPRPSRGR